MGGTQQVATQTHLGYLWSTREAAGGARAEKRTLWPDVWVL